MAVRKFSLIVLLFIASCHSSKTASVLKPSLIIDPSTVGTIYGEVHYEGVPPEPTKIPVASFKECANPRTQDEDVLIQDGKVRNAFVYIKEGLEGYAFPSASEEVALDQRGCLYTPRVLGLRTGQNLVVRNSDAFLHNVHALPKFSRSFNVGMNQGSSEIRRTFEAPEVMVPIRCDVHPWMRAYVGVLPHPYFAVTAVGGTFELRNVPPGTYTLEVWHERLGTKSIPLILDPREKKAVEVEF